MATQGTFNPGQEAATLSASPNISTVQARFDPNADVNSLVSALGSDANLNRANSMYAADMKRKTIEQTAKIESYTQEIRDSLGDGARSVTAAQIKLISPELVPTIRYAIAEKIGKMQGVKDAQALVAGIDADASFLDTDKRNAYVAEQRAKLVSEIPEGNDFFKAGVIQGIDAQFAQNQQRWQAKTDQYLEKKQTEYLSAEVVNALNIGGDVKAALSQLDVDRKNTSSLDNEQSKNTIVGSVIETAMNQKNPDLLDQIPDTLLNSTLKVKIDTARGQILERAMSDDRAMRVKRDDDRAEARRSAFQEINTKVANGQPLNPNDYLRLDPDVYTYAMAARDRPTISASQSATNASIVRQHILTTSTLGSGKSLSELRDQINGNGNLNPADQVALIEALPSIIEGRDILSDPRLRTMISTNIAPALADMQQHPEVKMGRFDGISLRADVMRHINDKVRDSFVSEHATTGIWPTGNAASALIDKAIAAGETMITKRLAAASAGNVPSASGATPAPTSSRRNRTPIPSAMPSAGPTPTDTRSTNKSLAEVLAEREKAER
tara:strand:- start:4898 stop:6559 length:1662 start_codon:yes stop_codon:yes gene_type:complete